MELRHCIYLLLLVTHYELSTAQTNQILQLLLRITPEQFYAGNELAYNFLGRASKITRHLDRPAKSKKLQPKFPDSMPFPCDVSNGRSPERPTSVHALRPGDIDVIGAMGDSLTAAFGAVAVDVPHVFIANRGVSWAIGGQGTWRDFFTLPNALKEFNPRLIGYSLGDALTWQKPAQFNVADGGAISQDLPHQAKILIKRMKSDERVNFKEDWKMVTIFIGGNDHCTHMCYEKENDYMESHRKSIMEALDILHDNVPRLIVNYVPGPNLEILMKFTGMSTECAITHSFECPCIVGLSYVSLRKKFIDIMRRWQLMDIEIGNDARYRDRDDFAVVVQEFTLDINFPLRPLAGRNVTDFSYMSADCFHFSQKCLAITANAIWNNLFEPVGAKTRDWHPILLSKFVCPTEANPYIFTWLNSNTVRRRRGKEIEQSQMTENLAPNRTI